MAKIVSTKLVITVSKIAKDGVTDTATLIPNKTVPEIEEIVQELLGDSVVVEVEVDG